jgi:outer membrane lipoprotein SlyB
MDKHTYMCYNKRTHSMLPGSRMFKTKLSPSTVLLFLFASVVTCFVMFSSTPVDPTVECVYEGTVLNVRKVTIDAGLAGIGAFTGRLAAQKLSGKPLNAAGNDGLELVVKVTNGATVDLVQPVGPVEIKDGKVVLLLQRHDGQLQVVPHQIQCADTAKSKEF